MAPQEADRLFDILRNMRDDGCAIIIITHKLQEVLALSDRVAILRKGQYIDTVETAQANVQSLSDMMVGDKVDLNIDRPKPENVRKRLSIQGLNCKDKDGVKTLGYIFKLKCIIFCHFHSLLTYKHNIHHVLFYIMESYQNSKVCVHMNFLNMKNMSLFTEKNISII